VGACCRAPEAKRVGREQLRETTASHELPAAYLLAEAAIEAFDKDIVHRFAGQASGEDRGEFGSGCNGLSGGFLPVPGQEIVEAGSRVFGAAQRVGEPDLRVDVVQLGGADQRVNDRGLSRCSSTPKSQVRNRSREAASFGNPTLRSIDSPNSGSAAWNK